MLRIPTEGNIPSKIDERESESRTPNNTNSIIFTLIILVIGGIIGMGVISYRTKNAQTNLKPNLKSTFKPIEMPQLKPFEHVFPKNTGNVKPLQNKTKNQTGHLIENKLINEKFSDNKARHKTIQENPESKLTLFIAEGLKKGYLMTDLISRLVDFGWPSELVNKKVNELTFLHNNRQKQMSKFQLQSVNKSFFTV